MPVGPKMTFAGSDASTISTPMFFSCALMSASCVVRVAFDAVHVNLNDALKPVQVKIAEFLDEGADGPPLQCFFSSPSAFAGL